LRNARKRTSVDKAPSSIAARSTSAWRNDGEDHVGIGSDAAVQSFDTSPEAMKEFQRELAERRAKGVNAPGEDRPLYVIGLNVPNRCEIIADALLQRHYPARVAEKVLGGNFVRAFRDIWKT
jgi:membrane dipeptidase